MNVIKRVAEGDNKALEELFLLYGKKVFRLALAILNDRFLSEDVVQETFLRVQQNAKSYQFRNSEREWIMTIAHNTAIDILRKRKKEIVQEEISYREIPDSYNFCAGGSKAALCYSAHAGYAAGRSTGFGRYA